MKTVPELVVDFLGRNGCTKTLGSLSQDRNWNTETAAMRWIEPMYAERQTIRAMILEGKAHLVIPFIQKHFPEVVEQEEELIFRVHCQNFIELVQQDLPLEAVAYAQRAMVEPCKRSARFMQILQDYASVLAYENPQNSPFFGLFEKSQRLLLADQVTSAIFRVKYKDSGVCSVFSHSSWLYLTLRHACLVGRELKSTPIVPSAQSTAISKEALELDRLIEDLVGRPK